MLAPVTLVCCSKPFASHHCSLLQSLGMHGAMTANIADAENDLVLACVTYFY